MLERGIKQLISQALDCKANVFQTRIEGVVQNYIYTQKHPQSQEKPTRKYKTLDEDTKSSSSDSKHGVICDISQLIPVPGPPSTVAKTTDGADKKSGAQESSKGGSTSSKGFQTVKKSYSTQGKSNVLVGRVEETKTGSPLYEKATLDESSRIKDVKIRTSRVKVESLSRDDSRLSPKVEENVKVKEEKNKISRVKMESSSPGESTTSSLAEDRGIFSAQGNKISSSGGTNENLNQIHLLPSTQEMTASQDDITRLAKVKMLEVKSVEVKTAEMKTPEVKMPEVKMPEVEMPEVKMEKGKTPEVKLPEVTMEKGKLPEVTMEKGKMPEVKMEKDNESVSLECKVKVKEERSELFGAREQNTPWQQKEEVKAGSEVKIMDEQEHGKILLNENAQIDTGPQRSDSFLIALDEMSQGLSRITEKPCVDVTVSADDINKVQESGERLESVKDSETVEKADGNADSKYEENNAAKSGVVTESSLRMTSTSDDSGIKTIDLPATQGVTDKVIKELTPDTRSGASEVIAMTDQIPRQTLPDESQELQLRQKDEPVRSESRLEKSSSAASSVAQGDLDQASSTGEYSDGESDISEVSSVHTSDLSSFDEQISSMSESYDEDEDEETRQGDTAEKCERKTDDDKDRTSMPQNEQDSNAPPRRRSTRISSRRSTKEGESEISENEASRKDSRESSHKRRRAEKRNRKPRPETVKGQSVSALDKPRRRGRPRKDASERRMSSHAGSQIRRSRTHDQEESSTGAERSGSDVRESRSTRSQRQIKRTRCYSPSSEGTREVFLPRKRSRDDPS